jgi:succinoglycan biosynthesis protein ExoM
MRASGWTMTDLALVAEPPGMPEVRVARIAIAIPTFRRPEMLDALLRGIALLTLPSEAAVDVFVLDNDDVTSAEPLVAAARETFPLTLHYRHVAVPGLSAIRNAALEIARQGYDLLAMIDDDEVPYECWLTELVRVQRETGADAVVGPVPQVLPADAPRWIRAGRFFALPTYSDGAAITMGYSGNCLLRTAAIVQLGLSFDEAFNFAGGEDMLFFRQLIAASGTIVYAAGAVADEAVAPSRLRASYIIALNYRRGNTLALIDRAMGARRSRLAMRAAKAASRAAIGIALLLPLSLLRGRCGAMEALTHIARGVGSFAGLAGHTYDAYRRNDSTEQ